MGGEQKSALPYRIDLFDDEIESIRTFDPDTQRTLYKVAEIHLLPAREVPLDEDGVSQFRQNFRERFEGDPSKSQLYKDVSNKLAPGGVEYYLPLFFDETTTLFDYLADGTAVVLHGDIQTAVDGFWQDTQSRYRLLAGEKHRPLLPTEDLFLPPDTFLAACDRFRDWNWAGEPELMPPLTLPPRPRCHFQHRHRLK
jgi:transcription-repair coupling factor (superfamily II helicase)